jgi:hypothetical protein
MSQRYRAALPALLLLAIAGYSSTTTATASTGQCAPQGAYQINVTVGDLACSDAYAIAGRYNVMGDKFQDVGSFKCASGNAMTLPTVFSCVSGTSEFAVSMA